MATTSKTSINSKDLTKRAIENKEGAQAHYVVFLSPATSKAMYTAKVNGDNTITDPRCCMRPFDSAPDIVCSLWVHVSDLYFDAMVKEKYVTNNLRVVLYCTINDTYTFKLAVNDDKDVVSKGSNIKDIDDIKKRISSRSGTVQPDYLKPEYHFVSVPQVRQKMPIFDYTPYNNNMPDAINQIFTGGTLTSAQFRDLTTAMANHYRCNQQLSKEERARSIATGARAYQPYPARTSRCETPPSIPAIPTLVIEGEWCLEATAAGQPFPYSRSGMMRY